MTEITIDINTLPSLKEHYDSICLRVNHNLSKICFGVLVSFLLISIILIVISVKTNVSNNPCSMYSSKSLASTVSTQCIRQIWSVLCGTSSFPPDGYTGWWNQSPQGQTMIPCTGLLANQCGVGSYSSILVYAQYCNPDFKG